MSEDLMFDPNSGDQIIKERGICLQEDCNAKRMYEVFKECESRVKGKPYTAETCEEEIVDLMEALDRCVGHKAFNKFA
ncbi:unnamed protein product [Parnassius apollo]|uniref:(apollo) hypothetical protein n=1 Tax=Parnassius apollo TaxID=110799 RepID=A0A8S3XDZ6_PARAO|nr:unnamed protein product [Parnassius apollo]